MDVSVIDDSAYHARDGAAGSMLEDVRHLGIGDPDRNPFNPVADSDILTTSKPSRAALTAGDCLLSRAR